MFNKNLLKYQDIKFQNNTIIYNQADSVGGLFHYSTAPGAYLETINNIFWGNISMKEHQIYGSINVKYSNVEGGFIGTGNIDLNPEFDPASAFYTLLSTSPCIDAGNPDPMYFDVGAGGNPLPPAFGSLVNDIGHCGGPNSLWLYWDWPMPVELTSFTATTRQGKVYLYWKTATEINNLGFEIERKQDNKPWLTVGFKEGHGTTTETKEYSYVDDISSITAYSLAYRLKQIDYDGSYEYSDVVLVDNPAPLGFALHQNFPNPYNPVTTITYSLPIKSQVELVVYNTLGEEVKQLVNGVKEAGSYSVELNATSLPSGIYFYRLQAGSFVETKKMVLMK
jgi:hypothetical protein